MRKVDQANGSGDARVGLVEEEQEASFGRRVSFKYGLNFEKIWQISLHKTVFILTLIQINLFKVAKCLSAVSHNHVESNKLSSLVVSSVVVNDGSNSACAARRLENNLSRPMRKARTKRPEGEISINVSLSFHHSKLDSPRA